MSEFLTAKDVIALLTLLAPGFIILWLRNRVAEGLAPDFTQQLFHFAVVSAAYYGLVTPVFNVAGGLTLPLWLWNALFYFFVPILAGLLLGWATEFELEYRLASRVGLHLGHRIPTAWDYRFGKVLEGTFVLVTLADGTTVAGRMAEGSFASSSKEERDIYIQEVWSIPEAGDWTQITPKRGMLLCGRDIRLVEFFGD